jgi:hypothetical protein
VLGHFVSPSRTAAPDDPPPTKASPWPESGNHILAELQRSLVYRLVRLNLQSPGLLKQFDILCSKRAERFSDV